MLKVIQAAQFDLLTKLQGDDRFFPIRLHPGRTRAAAREVLLLPGDVYGVHFEHVNFEDLRDRLTDLRLGRTAMDFKGVLLTRRAAHRLFSDERRDDDFTRSHGSFPRKLWRARRRPRR